MATVKPLSNIRVYSKFLNQLDELDKNSDLFTAFISSPYTSEHTEEKERNHPKISTAISIYNPLTNKYKIKTMQTSWSELPYIKTGHRILPAGNSEAIETSSKFYDKDKHKPTPVLKKLFIGYELFQVPNKENLETVTPRNDQTLKKLFPHLIKLQSSFIDEEFLKITHDGLPVYIPAAETIFSFFCHKHPSLIKNILYPDASKRLYTAYSYDEDMQYSLDMAAQVKASANKIVHFILKNSYTTKAYNSIHTGLLNTGRLSAASPVESAFKFYARYLKYPNAYLILQVVHSSLMVDHIGGDNLIYYHPHEKTEDSGLQPKPKEESGASQPQENPSPPVDLDSGEKIDPKVTPIEVLDDSLEILPKHLAKEWNARIRIKRNNHSKKRPKQQVPSSNPNEKTGLSPNEGSGEEGTSIKTEYTDDIENQKTPDIEATYKDILIQKGYSVETCSKFLEDELTKYGSLKKRVNAYKDSACKKKRGLIVYRAEKNNFIFFILDVEYRTYMSKDDEPVNLRPSILIQNLNMNLDDFISKRLPTLSKNVVSTGSWGEIDTTYTHTVKHMSKNKTLIDKIIGLITPNKA